MYIKCFSVVITVNKEFILYNKLIIHPNVSMVYTLQRLWATTSLPLFSLSLSYFLLNMVPLAFTISWSNQWPSSVLLHDFPLFASWFVSLTYQRVLNILDNHSGPFEKLHQLKKYEKKLWNRLCKPLIFYFIKKWSIEQSKIIG